MMKAGLRFRLIVIFMAVVILPLLAGAVWTFVGVKAHLVESVHVQNNLVAAQLSDKVDQVIQSRVDMVRTLAKLPQMAKMDAGELNSVLKSVKDNNEDIDAAGIINSAGMQIARSDNSNLLDLRDRSYFKEAAAGREYVVSEVLISKTTQKPIVVVSAPIRENGNFKGVIHLSLKLDAVVNLVNSTIIGTTGYAFIVDGTGRVVAHPNQQYSVEQKDMTSLPPVSEGMAGHSGAMEYSGDGTQWVASYAQTPLLKWVVVTQQPLAEATAGANYLVGITLLVLALGAVLAMLIIIIMSGRIVKPILQVRDEMLAIARGDLTRDEDVRASGEIGQLADSVDETRAGLKEIIGQLAEAGRQLKESTGLLTVQAQQTSAGASEAAATAGEIASTVDQVSKNLQEVSIASDTAAGSAKTGARGLEDLNSRMKSITVSSQEVSQVINSLTDTLNQVSRIVDIITSIADQTNLLALNAAIEAARAGDQGRGFAVVADEVRKLAEQSADAARQIGQMIGQVKAESDRVVAVMADDMDHVKEGARVVEEVGSSFKAILNAVSGLAEQIQSVAAAAEQVAQGIQNVAATTEEQTASMEEVASSTEQLDRMSAHLNDLAGKFKLR